MDQNTTNIPGNVNMPLSPSGAPDSMGSANGHKKVGPIVATLVIVLILIIAALYVFASRINQQAVPVDTTTAAAGTFGTNAVASAPVVKPVTGTADDPASLQKDLNASTQGVGVQNF